MTNMPFGGCSFDAVVSVSVIHHALKNDIIKTIDEIHRVLRRNGLFLANLASVKDYRYGKGEQVENGTFRLLENFKEKRFKELHHFFTKREASKLLSRFTTIDILPLITGTKEKPHHYWRITAIK
jgi:ubiquinone/menaquinone biosynthesis C-methylase UbiE